MLESAGVATALIDYPGHIFLLFDTGLAGQNAYKLPLDAKDYLLWEDRVWIPVEITRIAENFHQAWTAGIEELARLSSVILHKKLRRTAQAWETFPPPATLPIGTTVAPPERTAFELAYTQQYGQLEGMIDAYLQETYLSPLKADPANESLRARLLKAYLILRRYETALKTAFNALLEEQGDKVTLHNHLGITYLLKGEAA
jgi:hypothetical protein